MDDLQRLSPCSSQEVHPSQDSATKNFLFYTHQPWVTPSINRRDRTYRKMKKTGSEDRRTEVKNLRRTIQRQLRRSYWNYLNTVFTGEDTPDQAGKNKRFWSYIKHQKSSNTGVAPLKKDCHLTSDPKAQAELLNEQFQSVFGDGRPVSYTHLTLPTMYCV